MLFPNPERQELNCNSRGWLCYFILFPAIFIIVQSLFSRITFCFVMLVMSWSYPWDSEGRIELVIHVNYSFLFKSNGDFKSKVLSQNYSYYISNLLSISLYRLHQHINHIYYNAKSLGLQEILVNDSQRKYLLSLEIKSYSVEFMIKRQRVYQCFMHPNLKIKNDIFITEVLHTPFVKLKSKISPSCSQTQALLRIILHLVTSNFPAWSLI